MAEWSDWRETEDNPYLKWQNPPPDRRSESAPDLIEFEDAGLEFGGGEKSNGTFIPEYLNVRTSDLGEDRSPALALDAMIKALSAPLPAAYDGSQQVTAVPDQSALPTLTDPNTVIMGVIDIGMPLGHTRLRHKDGTSRILAAWQQLSDTRTPHLPFGKELLKDDIDKMILECSGNSYTGWLDEERFNRETGVVDMKNHYGHREAARFAAHGAHVMDVAAGCDPLDDPLFSDRVKIIAVNLPTIDVVGNSGEFLTGFALAGIERILALADAIWKKSFGPDDTNPPAPCPCPVIINMSFGQQAGAKSSIDVFPAYLDALKSRRREAVIAPVKDAYNAAIAQAKQGEEIAVGKALLEGAVADYAAAVTGKGPAGTLAQAHLKTVTDAWDTHEARASDNPGARVLPEAYVDAAEDFIWPVSTLNFVMSCGNDNLERCNAVLEPEPGKTLTLDWRLLPDDQTPNFVEVWTVPDKDAPAGLLAVPAKSVEVVLTPPGGGPPSKGKTDLDVGVTTLGTVAAVFRESHEVLLANALVAGPTVVRHVLCVAPTHRPLADRDVAEAGTWKISVTNRTTERVQCVLSVQTDQGLLPGSATSRRSYFDDEHYTRFNAYGGMGDLRETYRYPPRTADGENLDLAPNPFTGEVSPVKRHGTMNATAAHKQVTRLAGYRRLDGQPAPYSSTGRGKFPGKDDATEEVLPALGEGTLVTPVSDDSSRGPTAAMPSDDGAFHWGILASGGANGSVVAMNGTSVAAPQAARLVATELIERNFMHQSENQRLFHRARLSEEEAGRPGSSQTFAFAPGSEEELRHLIPVLGRGRIAPTPRRLQGRFGNE